MVRLCGRDSRGWCRTLAQALAPASKVPMDWPARVAAAPLLPPMADMMF